MSDRQVEHKSYATEELGQLVWHFSPAAIAALEKAGMVTRADRQTAMVRILMMDVLRDGETELNFFGIGLRIHRRGEIYLVHTLEE